MKSIIERCTNKCFKKVKLIFLVYSVIKTVESIEFKNGLKGFLSEFVLEKQDADFYQNDYTDVEEIEGNADHVNITVIFYVVDLTYYC